jgi:hypothetical protein
MGHAQTSDAHLGEPLRELETCSLPKYIIEQIFEIIFSLCDLP